MPASPARRLRLLALCTAVGIAVAAAAQALGGSDWWWLALPVALVLGWWRIADPGRCARR